MCNLWQTLCQCSMCDIYLDLILEMVVDVWKLFHWYVYDDYFKKMSVFWEISLCLCYGMLWHFHKQNASLRGGKKLHNFYLLHVFLTFFCVLSCIFFFSLDHSMLLCTLIYKHVTNREFKLVLMVWLFTSLLPFYCISNTQSIWALFL